MQSQGGVERIDLEQSECLFVLKNHIRVEIDKLCGPAVITLRIDNPEAHSVALEIRLM